MPRGEAKLIAPSNGHDEGELINISVKLRLRRGRDDDIIQYLGQAAWMKAKLVMLAMRSGNLAQTFSAAQLAALETQDVMDFDALIRESE
jgi:hypothetical protein